MSASTAEKTPVKTPSTVTVDGVRWRVGYKNGTMVSIYRQTEYGEWGEERVDVTISYAEEGRTFVGDVEEDERWYGDVPTEQAIQNAINSSEE